MTKINYNNKSIGDQFTANDANEIKTSVNDLYDHVDDVTVNLQNTVDSLQLNIDNVETLSKDASNIESGTLDDARLSSNVTKNADLQLVLSTKADLVSGKIPSTQLPSYVDDVFEYQNLADFPVIGESGKIYIAIDTGYTYRWSGSIYIQLNGFDLSGYVPITALSPIITTQPISVTIIDGATATFTVTAIHPLTSAISYQWQKREFGSSTWSNIVGATTASYTTGTLVLEADNQDAYRVSVTNSITTTVSNVAVLTVVTTPILSTATAVWYAKDYNATANAIPNANGPTLQTAMITRNPRGVFGTGVANQGTASGGGWLGGGFGGCTVTERYAAGRDGLQLATRAVFTSATSGIRYRSGPTLSAGTYTMVIDVASNTGASQTFLMSKDGESTTVTKTATTTLQQFTYEFTLGSTTTVDLRFCRPSSGNGDFIVDKAFLWAGNAASVPSDLNLGGHLYLGNNSTESVSCTAGELALTSAQNGQIDLASSISATSTITVFALVKRVGAYKAASLGRYPFLNTNAESIAGGANGPGVFLGFMDAEENLTGNFGTSRNAVVYGASGANIFPSGSCPNLYSNGEYHVISFQATTKNRSLWVDDCELANTHTDSWGIDSVSVSHLELGYNKGLDTFKLCAMALFSTSLSKDERHEVVDTLIAKAAESSITVNRPKNILIVEGDSITVGPASNSYAQQYLSNATGSNLSIYNIAANPGSMLSSNVVPELNLSVRLPYHLNGIPKNLIGRKAIVTMFFGANDLASYSVANYLTEYYTYVAQLQALGCKVGICTILAKGTAQSGYVAFNILRNAVNTQLRADVATKFDFIIDFAADAIMGTDSAPNNATYFNSTDTLHPTVIGHTILEPIYRAAVNAQLV